MSSFLPLGFIFGDFWGCWDMHPVGGTDIGDVEIIMGECELVSMEFSGDNSCCLCLFPVSV